jgi:hypothetical protein
MVFSYLSNLDGCSVTVPYGVITSLKGSAYWVGQFVLGLKEVIDI